MGIVHSTLRDATTPYPRRCAPLKKEANAQSKECFTHIAFLPTLDRNKEINDITRIH